MPYLTGVNEDTNFAILRIEGRIPVLARCTRCDMKFFTPLKHQDPVSAHEYLWAKFLGHHCVSLYRMKQAG